MFTIYGGRFSGHSFVPGSRFQSMLSYSALSCVAVETDALFTKCLTYAKIITQYPVKFIIRTVLTAVLNLFTSGYQGVQC